MRMSRSVVKVKFGIALVGLVLLPTQLGLQEFGGSMLPRAETDRVREQLLRSPLGTVHAALFSLPRPLGAALPPPISLASLHANDDDITGSIGGRAPMDMGERSRVFPEVNRADKGDRLVPHPLPEPASAPTQPPASKPQQGAERAPVDGEASYTLASVSLADAAPSPDAQARDPAKSDVTADAPASATTTVPVTNVALTVDSTPAAEAAGSAAQPTLPADVDAFDDDDTSPTQTASIY